MTLHLVDESTPPRSFAPPMPQLPCGCWCACLMPVDVSFKICADCSSGMHVTDVPTGAFRTGFRS